MGQLKSLLNLCYQQSILQILFKFGSMFGNWVVNNQDWHTVDDYFKELKLQIVNHYINNQPHKQWLNMNKQKSINVYSSVYNLCTSQDPRSERMYAFFQNVLQQYVILCEEKSIEKQQPLNLLLKEARQWQGYCELSKICKRIFQYLDRYYVSDNGVETVSDKILSTYQAIHLNSMLVISLIGEVMVNLSEKRQNQSFDDDILLKISTMFKKVSEVTKSTHYSQLYESILGGTRLYYVKQYEIWQQQSPEVYINHAISLLQRQKNAFKLILPSEDSENFNKIFEDQVIQKYLPTLLKHQKGFKLFFSQERIQFLKKIYQFLKSYNILEDLKKFYYNHYTGLGCQLFSSLKNEQDSDKLLEKFTQFYIHTSGVTNDIFSSSPQFSIQFRKVMEMIVHLHDEEFGLSWKLVDYINKHFTLKTNNKSLKPVLTMFDCMTNKDIFIQTYEANLTTRLISGECPEIEEEKKFIDEIRQKCGQNFTQSIDRKIQDYSAAKTLDQEFKALNPNLTNKFSIKVLSKKFWTLQNKPNSDFLSFNIVWPQQLGCIKESFQKFFNQKYDNRHIKHLPLLSTVIAVIRYKDQQKFLKYETQLTLLQISLIIFIEKSVIEVPSSELMSKFQMNQQILNSQIKSLTQGSNPLLLIGEVGFKFNEFFNPLKGDLNIDIPNLRKNSKTEASNIDRQLAIQGAIVKILKNKGKQEFYELITQVQSQLKFFKPSVTKIKEAMEKLLQKQFIERSPQETNIFIYKA